MVRMQEKCHLFTITIAVITKMFIFENLYEDGKGKRRIYNERVFRFLPKSKF